MPNWCGNRLAVSLWCKVEDEDKARKQMKEFVSRAEVIEEGGEIVNSLSMYNLYPMPKELEDTKAHSDKPNWYDWRVEHWGTKWDISACLNYDDEEYLEYSFESSWAPPVRFLEKVSKDFPLLKFVLKYEEEGVGFIGRAIACNGLMDDVSLEC